MSEAGKGNLFVTLTPFKIALEREKEIWMEVEVSSVQKIKGLFVRVVISLFSFEKYIS